MNTSSPRRTVLVTGASAGLGAAFARVFAANGFDLVLTARRADRLRALGDELASRHGVTARIIPADLEDPGAPARLVGALEADALAVDALVNNAGYGLPGRYAETPWSDQSRFLQIMVTAYAEMVHRLLPGMVARRYGRIINVASVAGLVPGTPGHTLYAASKAFLIKFSQSLALENVRHDVRVTAVCPGFTYTEFHDVNGTRDMMSRNLPKWMWLDADAVARHGFDAVMAGKPIAVKGAVYKTITLLARYLPESVMFRWTLSQSRKFRRV